MRLKGGALMYCIFVILLSSAVLLMIITGYAIQRNNLESLIQLSRNERNATSAAELYLTGELSLKAEDSITVDLFADEASFVDLALSRWGSLNILSSNAKGNGQECQYYFLSGFMPQDADSIGLYLADKGRYLSISGNTKLGGVCFLPAATAIPASIEGQPCQNGALTTAMKFPSKMNLPHLDNEICKFGERYLQGDFPPGDSVIFLNSTYDGYLSRSFALPTIIGLASTDLVLSGSRIQGRVVLISSSKIILMGDSEMNDVILVAPEIEVQSGFSGNLQAFASRSIKIENDCIFELPSVLAVLQMGNFHNTADSLQILIGANCEVSGSIFIDTDGLTSYLKVGAGSTIMGQAYCPGPVELLGSIEGSLFCNSFFLRTNRSRYDNHLLNNSIDFNKLSLNFGCVDLFGKRGHKTILKCLD
jgi:hypothetical protein